MILSNQLIYIDCLIIVKWCLNDDLITNYVKQNSINNLMLHFKNWKKNQFFFWQWFLVEFYFIWLLNQPVKEDKNSKSIFSTKKLKWLQTKTFYCFENAVKIRIKNTQSVPTTHSPGPEIQKKKKRRKDHLLIM